MVHRKRAVFDPNFDAHVDINVVIDDQTVSQVPQGVHLRVLGNRPRDTRDHEGRERRDRIESPHDPTSLGDIDLDQTANGVPISSLPAGVDDHLARPWERHDPPGSVLPAGGAGGRPPAHRAPTGPSVSARCARSQPVQGLPNPADGLADPLFVLHEGEADMAVAGGAEADPGTHGHLGFLEEVEGETQ